MQELQYSEQRGQFSTDFCHGLSMFGALSDDSLDFMLQRGRLLQVDAGETLFSVGDKSDMFYVVLKGTVRFFQAKDESGIKVPLRKYQIGEQVGFVGMIGLHQRRGDALMEESGYLMEISSELFHQLCEKFPEMFQIFLINIAREMSREISHLDQMYIEKN